MIKTADGEVVFGNELRVGDKILAEVNELGVVLAGWGGTRLYRGPRGIYWKENSIFSPKPSERYDDRFTASHRFLVAIPRPEPEINEFGPVSP